MNTTPRGSIPTKWLLLLGVIAGLVLGELVSVTASWSLSPPIDSNLQAYIYLANGMNSGRYDDARELARQAHSIARDPDLRYLADVVRRSASISIEADIETFEEANSISGLGKSVVAGFLNPLLGIKGGTLAIEMLWNDLDATISLVNDRYQAIFQSRQRASLIAGVLFWACAIGVPTFVVGFRKHSSAWLQMGFDAWQESAMLETAFLQRARVAINLLLNKRRQPGIAVRTAK